MQRETHGSCGSHVDPLVPGSVNDPEAPARRGMVRPAAEGTSARGETGARASERFGDDVLRRVFERPGTTAVGPGRMGSSTPVRLRSFRPRIPQSSRLWSTVDDGVQWTSQDVPASPPERTLRAMNPSLCGSPHYPIESLRTRRRCRWQTLVHRIRIARRVKSGTPRQSRRSLLHRLSPSRVGETQTDEPLRRTRVGVRNIGVWD
jgi:hypothetical protein